MPVEWTLSDQHPYKGNTPNKSIHFNFFFGVNKGNTPNKGNAFAPIFLDPIKATPQIKATLWIFFDLIKATQIFGGTMENRSNCEVHNGGRVPRAALREAVMTKATPASIGSVNVSGL